MTKELTEVEAVRKAIAASRVPGSTLTLADVFSPELIGRTAQTAIEAHKAHLSASGPKELKDLLEKALREAAAETDSVPSYWRDLATGTIAALSASGCVIVPREVVEALDRLSIEQYAKMKFTAPDCKCGKCQLVPLDVVLEASAMHRRLALSDKEG
jgi:hypothetical protein